MTMNCKLVCAVCCVILFSFMMSLPDSCTFSSLLRISNQYKQLDAIRKDIQGLYVLPRENDPYTWDGVIFVSTGVWEEGIFKFTLQIPKGYSL